mmetsp:Transcript_10723/g.32932  ORF Transcript_10723/g.32932 Transcript_10723/m.32932 type:complete len:242 (-) Transcript_10723:1405-2130(-)
MPSDAANAPRRSCVPAQAANVLSTLSSLRSMPSSKARLSRLVCSTEVFSGELFWAKLRCWSFAGDLSSSLLAVPSSSVRLPCSLSGEVALSSLSCRVLEWASAAGVRVRIWSAPSDARSSVSPGSEHSAGSVVQFTGLAVAVAVLVSEEGTLGATKMDGNEIGGCEADTGGGDAGGGDGDGEGEGDAPDSAADADDAVRSTIAAGWKSARRREWRWFFSPATDGSRSSVLVRTSTGLGRDG